MDQLLIYIPKITSRHKYVFAVIFNEICRTNYELTDNKESFLESYKAKINYSKNTISSEELFVESSDLLSERDLKEVDLDIFKECDKSYLFKSDHQESYKHDVFAAVFYLVSRYEEYLPHLKDKYGRYLPSESVAYKHNFLRKPIVNIWIQEFISHLQTEFPAFSVPTSKFEYISTIDIDNAYLFKGKGFVRSAAFLIKSLLKLDFIKTKLAYEVITQKRKDPYDTYSLQFNLQKKYNIDVRYFVLLGDYGLNDKNISHVNSSLISLVKRLADLAPVGIHPSYGSNLNSNILSKEIKRLKDIQKREVSISRQHFLQLSLPETYKKLIESGITNDYTMGYASELGFRAGIATPFTFYDLDMEQTLPITIHPFAITDDILRFNLELNCDNVLSEISEIVADVKKVNGTLISVWHNDTFSNFGLWEGWKNVYEDMVRLINLNDESN